MAINERIRFFRNLRGLTQKDLGIAIGLPEKTADIRMAQYEKGGRSVSSRCPKDDMIEKLADVLDVSPKALKVPNTDKAEDIIYTLFTLEDLYGLQIDEVNGEPILRLKPKNNRFDGEMLKEAFAAWLKEAQKQRNGEIVKEEYDNWRYNFSLGEDE